MMIAATTDRSWQFSNLPNRAAVMSRLDCASWMKSTSSHIQDIGGSDQLYAWLVDGFLLLAPFPKCKIRIYNHSAGAVWRLLSEGGRSLPEVARKYAELFEIDEGRARTDVQYCIDEWIELGWVSFRADTDEYYLNSASVEVGTDDSTGRVTDSYSLQTPVDFEEVYQFDDGAFGVRIHCVGKKTAPHVLQQLLLLLKGFWVSKKSPEEWLTIHLLDEVTLLQSRSKIEIHSDPIKAGNKLLSHLFQLAYPRRSLLAVIHAAGVGRKSAIILPAVSGSGKSTLAAYLAKRGWWYYGDDMIGVSSECELLALPTSVKLKSGSWNVLHAFYPELHELEPVFHNGIAIQTLTISQEHPTGVSGLRAMVFPKYEENSPVLFEELSMIETLRRLIESSIGFGSTATPQSVSAFLHLLCGIKKYSLVYSSLEEAEACLSTLIER
jgi:Coenzyme PQQ synthesis protein D (PqqD)